jgi:nucleoside 2-deoxyribosyltransferase
MSLLPNIYFAGPDVFKPDHARLRAAIDRICERLGALPLHPSDNVAATAEGIYQGNVDMLRRADAVVANLEAFRSQVEPDSGTCFEIGFATARGVPVAAYLPPHQYVAYLERVTQWLGSTQRDGRHYDARDGLMIEDFGHPVNLMLASSASLHRSCEDAVAAVLQRLRG